MSVALYNIWLAAARCIRNEEDQNHRVAMNYSPQQFYVESYPHTKKGGRMQAENRHRHAPLPGVNTFTQSLN